TKDVVGTTTSCANGVVQIAATGAQPDTIALDGDWVYWHDATGIFRAKKTGGGVETLATSTPYFWPDLTAFAVGAAQLVYGDGSSIIFQGSCIGKLATPGFAASNSYVFAWSRDVYPSPFFRFAFDGTLTSSGAFPRKPVEMTFVGPGVPCVAEDPGIECD